MRLVRPRRRRSMLGDTNQRAGQKTSGRPPTAWAATLPFREIPEGRCSPIELQRPLWFRCFAWFTPRQTRSSSAAKMSSSTDSSPTSSADTELSGIDGSWLVVSDTAEESAWIAGNLA